MTKDTDFSKYNTVFCDSKEALKWAYKEGLPRDAIILTSSPSMLWDKKEEIKHVESRWSLEEFREFQSSIKKFSEDVYDSVINKVSHEKSVCIANTAVGFNKIIFKAACLTREHLIEPSLFIRTDGECGPLGNNMNSPWDLLLNKNHKFKTVVYHLKNNEWSLLSVDSASILKRAMLGGLDTLYYRFLIKFTRYIPNIFFKKQVLITRENELVIETASYLSRKGIWVKYINPNLDIKSHDYKKRCTNIEKCIYPIIEKRIRRWLCSEQILVSTCIELFISEVYKTLDEFEKWSKRWECIKKESYHHNNILLTNAPGNTKGLALTEYCRKLDIPVVSAQHGITPEICSTHSEVSAHYEINASDVFLAYNYQSAKITKKSHFSMGRAFVVGLSSRHLRVKKNAKPAPDAPPIVYISTNLYKGNISWFGTCLTDYHRAKKEQSLVMDVLSRLPHKVRYKPYPIDNRRFADNDPVLDDIKNSDNIQLFDKKIDLRYLMDDHRILITSMATSTIGWAVMTGKPVIFINWKNNNPLTEDAHKYFSKGLFLFDDCNDNFPGNLLDFLSQPIDKIEKLYNSKKEFRHVMINKFFTSFESGAGKRAAIMLMKEYLR